VYATQAPYRGLHEALLEYQGSRTFEELLLPWLDVRPVLPRDRGRRELVWPRRANSDHDRALARAHARWAALLAGRRLGSITRARNRSPDRHELDALLGTSAEESTRPRSIGGLGRELSVADRLSARLSSGRKAPFQRGWEDRPAQPRAGRPHTGRAHRAADPPPFRPYASQRSRWPLAVWRPVLDPGVVGLGL